MSTESENFSLDDQSTNAVYYNNYTESLAGLVVLIR